MTCLDATTADFALLEELVLSDQMEHFQVIDLLRRRPDFASWFKDRRSQRFSLAIAAE